MAKEVGYNSKNGFDYTNFELTLAMNKQSEELQHNARRNHVGDSRVVWGYACNETPECLPLPVVVAERIAEGLDNAQDKIPYLRPDGKVQVTRADKLYITVAAQHEPGVKQARLLCDILEYVVGPIVGTHDVEVIVNSSGSFVEGGHTADKGTSNVKLCAYGEAMPHGGGGPWGKDATKPEVFGFLAARRLARDTIERGVDACSVQLAYSIGVPRPLVVREPAVDFVPDDLLPDRIIEEFRLRDPNTLYQMAAGKLIGNPNIPWERKRQS